LFIFFSTEHGLGKCLLVSAAGTLVLVFLIGLVNLLINLFS
jgi:hypothetical protein